MKKVLAVTPVVLCALGVDPDRVRVVGIPENIAY